MSDVEVLFERHHVRLFRFFLRMTGKEAVAEDLTQEVFVRVMQSPARYMSGTTERAWLFTVARAVLVDHWRDRGKQPPVVGFDEESDHPNTGPALQLVALGVAQAISRLAASDQELLILREQEGLDYEEIAAILKTSAASVRRRLCRARERVRAMLPVHVSARRRGRGEEES